LSARQLPPALADKAGEEGKTLAYRCVGGRCEAPIESLEALQR
jgi:hypothetical protein